MTSPAIQSALQQMQSLASQASQSPLQGAQAADAVDTKQGSFGSELAASLHRINELKQTAASQAQAFQSGDSNLELNDVMMDMQKASVASEMGLQVRNRLVSAYRDVMNMQV
ncbi:flagellar hook-basal body complex protein FliE [Vreelandella subglaciescola]|uniref:Flagellar hook-basal body complex protein FliE n=1 Tax=Vreelandella subglaciescola TaxID=29571 RepID=A0A1M7HGC1_9GAMM|nr:flagellar hook-basal body complex protein FliE [Halomonas subglaciescola]SHM27393.1 flagellar hook-basal body complex protein FliE [Halomonas subglaciescola]